MNVSDDSPSTAVLTPILAGTFMRMDYTWSYQDNAQEGSLLIGHDSGSGVASAQWVDTWHMGKSVMSCLGTSETDGSIDVAGTYAAPPARIGAGASFFSRAVARPSASSCTTSRPMGPRSWLLRPPTHECRRVIGKEGGSRCGCHGPSSNNGDGVVPPQPFNV